MNPINPMPGESGHEIPNDRMPADPVITSSRPLTLAKAKILDDRITDAMLGYASDGSAGMDMRAVLDEPLTLEPGQCELIHTGVAIHLKDPGLAGMLLPRGGLGVKHGIVLGNLVGLMDADYQGEVLVPLWNRSGVPYTIEPFERIAQYVVVPVFGMALTFVDQFDMESGRGEGRLSSTGRF